MKKFIIKILIFIALLVAIDCIIGVTFDYISSNAKGGKTARYKYINDETSEDLLILGSSHAVHHHIPSIYEQHTGLSAYNCGVDGNGIILAYMQLKNILNRYTPKIIIYEYTPNFDVLKNDNHKYLGAARQLYGRPEIDSVFLKVDPMEQYKMKVNSYKYNSEFTAILTDYLRSKPEGYKGYLPFYGIIDYPVNEADKSSQKVEFDEVKLYYLNHFMKDCSERGIKLIVAISPQYLPAHIEMTHLKRLAAKYHIKLFDFSNDTTFLNHNELFYDSTHLNNVGAELYTKKMISTLQTAKLI
jgi:hypothetical protein